MPAGYVVRNTAEFALADTSAHTMLNVINAANGLIRITALSVSFDGISSVAEPVYVELTSSTQGAAGTGTASAPAQIRGPTRTVQATGVQNYTVEPTTQTTIHHWFVHPQSGITIEYPFGREPEQITTADGLCLRLTAQAAVNARGWIEFEEG